MIGMDVDTREKIGRAFAKKIDACLSSDGSIVFSAIFLPPLYYLL